MNELIRQLAEQAEILITEVGAFHNTPQGAYQLKEQHMKKFAWLIVQECIHALWTEECRINAMTQADYERSGNRIHKHFYGVE